MSLTLQALKWMLGLAVLAVGLPLYLALSGYDAQAQFITAGLNIAILAGFYRALRKPIHWVAYLVGVVCIFDFFGAIAAGFTIENLLNLADAILSFVAVCGIFIWIREKRAATSKEPSTKPQPDLQ